MSNNAIIEVGGEDRPPMLAPAMMVKDQVAAVDKERAAVMIRFLTPKSSRGLNNENGILLMHVLMPRKCGKKLKQGENINKQDVETNLYWEFGKFKSKDGESIESYYSRFYKIRNELVRNQCIIDNHYVNVQFLLQLKSEWQRSPAATKSKRKEIAIAPSPRESDHEVASDEEETLRDKKIQKLMALISTSFKKIYTPTNNNLRTSNTRNKYVGNTLRLDKRIRYDRQTGQYKNQRAVNVVGNRENVGTLIVQHNGIQCFNCKEFRHVAKECKKSNGQRILLIIRKKCRC
nr:hypothetical protein [Tanacetum cinerariifolium]